MPRNIRLAEPYGLPKTHKPNTPLRPVVSACNTARTCPYINKDGVISKLPYPSENESRIARKVIDRSNFNINLVYEHTNNIKDQLVSTALSPLTCSIMQYIEVAKREADRKNPCICCLSGLKHVMCDKSNVVYLVACKICQEEYVGETGRVVRTRLQEHYFQAWHHTRNTPWGDHMAKYHPDVNLAPGGTTFSWAKILAIESRMNRRMLRKAAEIRDRKLIITLGEDGH